MKLRLLLATCLLLTAATSASAQSASTWFLAEGASNALFTEEILVANPSTSDLAVTIRLLPDPGAGLSGSPARTFVLKALSRGTYKLKTEFPTLNGATSAEVSAVSNGTTTPADIVVERSMYFPDANRAGGHNASGVTAAAQRWTLAEGASNIFNTFVLVTNPNANPVEVKVTYLKSGGTPITFNEVLPASSRRTFWPQVDYPVALGNAEFSTIVESVTAGKPIVAERAMYFDYGPTLAGTTFARSGHDALGVPAPSTTWYFAEGFTGQNGGIAFETFLLLANQNTTDVDVTVTYQLDSGQAVSRVYTVPAQQRYTVWVDQEGRVADARLLSAAFGITVEAPQPIVAERSMYWGTPSAADPTTPMQPWAEGHATAGAPTRSARWGFAEGAQDYLDASGTRYQTFLLFSNPNTTPIAVRATFLREDGTGIQRNVCVPANGRANLWTIQFPELSNQRFASFVETVATAATAVCPAATSGGEMFVAERAMYWGTGYTGGHVNIGTPWTGTLTAPSAPEFTLRATLSAPTTGRLSGGEWVDLTVENVAADAQVLFGGRPAAAVQFDPENKRIRAQTPMRTVSTGFGSTGAAPVQVKSAGRTTEAGTFTFTLNVLAFGDSLTYGVSNMYISSDPATKFPVEIRTPYPLAVKNALSSNSRFRLVNVTNGGVPGERAIGQGEARLPRCLATGPSTTCLADSSAKPSDFVRPYDVVVILEGINDIIFQAPPARVRDAMGVMTQIAQAATVPVVMTVFDSYTTRYDGTDTIGLFQARQMNDLIWALTGSLGLSRIRFQNIDMSQDGLHPTQLGYDQMAERVTSKVVENFPP